MDKTGRTSSPFCSCIGNPGKFLLSTVDPDLTEMARKIAGVPVIFLHGSTMVLEKPTNKSVEIAEEETKNCVVVDEVSRNCVYLIPIGV